MTFKTDDKITVIGVSDFMANTVITRAVCTGYLAGRPTFRLPKKRKQFYLRDFTEWQLVFRTHDLPFKTDVEGRTNGFMGNACINLMADDAEKLKTYLQSENINPNFTKWNRINIVTKDEQYIPLFENELA